MFKLNCLLSILLIVYCAQESAPIISSPSCDLYGHWSQINMIIDSKGSTQDLSFTEKNLSEDLFLEHAQTIHKIYFSGHGNIEIEQTPTLSFSRKNLSYKGTKLGRYLLSDDCKTIKLKNLKVQNTSDIFASCKVLYRYENIIAMEQGDQIVYYLRRDPSNPFFVGAE